MITAIVPVSTIPSHPDTAILTETLDSIRYWLPDSEIVLCFDGVHPSQEHRAQAYEEHIQNALWLADHHYGNICPLIFDRHEHQTGMLSAALSHVETPLLLYVEHDTPLVTDELIEFDLLTKQVLEGQSNIIRLHHEALILDEHKHLMHGEDGNFTRTSQWSQRPHIASVAFYQRICDHHLAGKHAFIEDVMHSVVDTSYQQFGMQGWDQFKLHIYNPGGNLKRSYHLDGRAGDPKCD
jgi:hypothetical protein